MANPKVQKPHKEGDCWGCLKHSYGYCFAKPRKGKLTCGVHKWLERDAIALRDKLEAELLAKTCFHCGESPVVASDPPRCERHADIVR